MNRRTDYIKYYLPLLLIPLLIWLTGCSVDSVSESEQSLSAQDIAVIGNIMGETLSNENSGVTSGIADAVADVSQVGLRPGLFSSSSNTLDEETNFQYSFDPSTGIHLISFTRNVDIAAFSKNISDTSSYLYSDKEGNIIETLNGNRDRIENLVFTAVRDGSVETLLRSSTFTRMDTLIVDGLSPSSPVLEIDGKHVGRGLFKTVTENGTEIERNYSVEINILDLQIQKDIVRENRDVTQGITGTLTWEIDFENPNGTSDRNNVLRGNIEMFGDGTALLRFNRDEQNTLQVNIERGEVRDSDKEFEGRVRNVMVQRRAFRLVNGRTIQLNDETRIRESGDLTSLQEVFNALRGNTNVRAEGEGSNKGNGFLATDVKFELRKRGDDEDDDDDNNEDERREVEFESPVERVNQRINVITLQNRLRILITENTVIENGEDEISSLADLEEAIRGNREVIAEGEGLALQTGPADIEATEIEFETEDDNNEDDDGDEDDNDDDN